MTDRFTGLTVALDHDIREDDAAAVIGAIQQLRGVVAVSGVKSDPLAWATEQRVRREMIDSVLEALKR